MPTGQELILLVSILCGQFPYQEGKVIPDSLWNHEKLKSGKRPFDYIFERGEIVSHNKVNEFCRENMYEK